MMTPMTTRRTPLGLLDNTIWVARMGWAVGRLYTSAVTESWRRQIAIANAGHDALFIYAIRDSWERAVKGGI